MKKLYCAALAAATVVVPAALVSAPASAEGFHAEIHSGWDHVSVSGYKDDGIAYGVGLGYDLPLGDTAFIGIEGSADDANTKKCVSGLCVSTKRDLSAVARVGAKVGGNYKLYALAGYANGRVSATGLGSANGDGFRAGAGVQAGFGSHLYGKLEYRYTNYEAGFTRNQVLAGLGVEF